MYFQDQLFISPTSKQKFKCTEVYTSLRLVSMALDPNQLGDLRIHLVKTPIHLSTHRDMKYTCHMLLETIASKDFEGNSFEMFDGEIK